MGGAAFSVFPLLVPPLRPARLRRLDSLRSPCGPAFGCYFASLRFGLLMGRLASAVRWRIEKAEHVTAMVINGDFEHTGGQASRCPPYALHIGDPGVGWMTLYSSTVALVVRATRLIELNMASCVGWVERSDTHQSTAWVSRCSIHPTSWLYMTRHQCICHRFSYDAPVRSDRHFHRWRYRSTDFRHGLTRRTIFASLCFRLMP
jgi:hypothetical protein